MMKNQTITKSQQTNNFYCKLFCLWQRFEFENIRYKYIIRINNSFYFLLETTTTATNTEKGRQQ